LRILLETSIDSARFRGSIAKGKAAVDA